MSLPAAMTANSWRLWLPLPSPSSPYVARALCFPSLLVALGSNYLQHKDPICTILTYLLGLLGVKATVQPESIKANEGKETKSKTA